MASKSSKNKKGKLVAKLVREGDRKSPCVFCNRQVDDEIIYGKLYSIGDIQCHYFCVLLSSCLVQKGQDEDGLFGFLYPDIMAEVERSKKHRCSYCGLGGAGLGCSVSQCRKQFHLPCGRERNAVSLFYGNYKSFCQKHAPKQKIPEVIMANVKSRKKSNKKIVKTCNINENLSNLELEQNNDDSENQSTDMVCVICYEAVDGSPTLQTFWPPCCAKDAWFHRTCLQRMALSAGMHYLKCPLCNDKENFYRAVVNQGYYVPDRDAAWELEQNAFAEIYERPVICGAIECKCSTGRDFNEDSGMWEIRLCALCGSNGIHEACDAEPAPARHVCATCAPAAPADWTLIDTQDIATSSQRSNDASGIRRGPIMPSRMSLRRTKRRLLMQSGACSSNSSLSVISDKELEDSSSKSIDLTSSRLELNLKSPKRPLPQITTEGNVLQNIENKLLSPTKLIEQGLKDKICGLDAKEYIQCDSGKIVEVVREKWKKPRPLSEKRKILNNILEDVFKDLYKETTKTKEPVKEWSSPKKCCDIKDEVSMELNQGNMDTNQPIVSSKEELNFHNNIFKNENSQKHININANEEVTAYTIITDAASLDNENGDKSAKVIEHTQISHENLENVNKDVNGDITEYTKVIEAKSVEDVNESENGEVIEHTQLRDDEHCTFTDNVDEQHLQVVEQTRSINGTLIIEDIQEIINVEENDEFTHLQQENTEKTSSDSNWLEIGEKAGLETKTIKEIENDEHYKSPLHQMKLLENIEENSQQESISAEINPKIDETFENNVINKSNIDIEQDLPEDESSSSTFQLPPEFIADNNSDDSLPIFDTPKKLTTVEIKKDSSLEISENDNQDVNIDVIKMANSDNENNNEDFIKNLKLKSPVKTKKCAFKFSPVDKETLQRSNVDIDLESFKNHYLNEVGRDFKCNFDHKHLDDYKKSKQNGIRTAIDFAMDAANKVDEDKNDDRHDRKKLKRILKSKDKTANKKRKMSKDKRILLKYNKEHTKIKFVYSESKTEENGSIDLTIDPSASTSTLGVAIRQNDENPNSEKNKRLGKKFRKRKEDIQVKIKWKEELKLKIMDGKSKRIKKKPEKKKILKQCILKYYSKQFSLKNLETVNNVTTPIKKRQRRKTEKTPDNMIQTNIHNYFQMLPIDKC